MTTLITKPASPATAAADGARRRISGCILPYGRPGHSSAGRITVTAGAVAIPDDVGRVKLLRDHSDNPRGCQPVGRALSIEERDDGLYATFEVGPGDDGDRALSDVRSGIRDALSVELVGVTTSGEHLAAGTLSAVALVPIPAFDDARVTEFSAARKETITMSADDTTTAAPTVPNPHNNAANRLRGAAGTVNSVADQLSGSGSPDEPATDQTSSGPKPPATASLSAARVPSNLDVMPRRHDNHGPVTFAQAIETIRAVRNREPLDDRMTAALTDITRSANPAISAPAWLGELWEGNSFSREIVPLMTHGTLTRMKAVGYRWTKKPKVADYAGDKAEIPTSPVATEAVEVAAKRLATGNDIDRAYWDFNESEFINAYFRALSESYAMVTDEKAAAFLATSAAGNVKPKQPTLLYAAAAARQAVKRGARVEPTAYLVHPDDMFELLKITTMDNPSYLTLIGVDPAKFVSTDQAKKGSVIAFAKPAVTFYELPGSPIRVVAEDIARGGRDAAVFGYWATLLNNQSGIVEVPFGAGDRGEG